MNKLLLIAAAWLLGQAPLACAQSPRDVSADEVKAAFLFRFAAFVEWPPETKVRDSIVIGVLGAEEIEAELRRAASARQAQSQPVVVRRVTGVEEIPDVRILFVGSRESYRLSRIVAALKGLPVLVVTDAPDALERGAMINFVTTDRVQFEVGLDAAARAGLRLNSRLLSVASRIKKGETVPRTLFAEGREQSGDGPRAGAPSGSLRPSPLFSLLSAGRQSRLA